MRVKLKMRWRVYSFKEGSMDELKIAEGVCWAIAISGFLYAGLVLFGGLIVIAIRTKR
jgi:hypothetical protein